MCFHVRPESPEVKRRVYGFATARGDVATLRVFMAACEGLKQARVCGVRRLGNETN